MTLRQAKPDTMKMIRLTIMASAAMFLAACSSLGNLGDYMEAGKSGCDPRSRQVVPFTPSFKVCKEHFPKLAEAYKAKEDRVINGQCDAMKGDSCYEWKRDRFGDSRINEKQP